MAITPPNDRLREKVDKLSKDIAVHFSEEDGCDAIKEWIFSFARTIERETWDRAIQVVKEHMDSEHPEIDCSLADDIYQEVLALAAVRKEEEK